MCFTGIFMWAFKIFLIPLESTNCNNAIGAITNKNICFIFGIVITLELASYSLMIIYEILKLLACIDAVTDLRSLYSIFLRIRVIKPL
jgi:hypothetical protein